MSRLPLAVDPDRLLRETLAHEYFHGVQCRIAPRLDLLPASIVEGTANWMAAAVTDDWARAEGPFLGTLPGRLLRSAVSTRSITLQGYDAWGFWFQATQGATRPSLIRTLFRRSANRTRRTPATPTCAPSSPRSSRPCSGTRWRCAARGRSAGRTCRWRTTTTCATPRRCSTWDGAARRPSRWAIDPIGYRFPGVAWEDDAGRVTIRVSGTAGSSVELVGAAANRIQRDGSTVFEIDAELAGEATVVIVNAGAPSVP